MAFTSTSCTITTGTSSFVDPAPGGGGGGAAVFKIFEGHLRRGLAANQDETAKSMRSSNSLLPSAGKSKCGEEC